MSASRLLSRPTSDCRVKKAKSDLVWRRRHESLVDVRLPGLESGGIVTGDSFRNRLHSLRLYFTERPRPPWLRVSILALAAFAILCSTLWLLVSLDWPFVSGGKATAVARRNNGSHRGNGTAPPSYEDFRSEPASRPTPTKSARLTTSEMDSVPPSSDLPFTYADGEPTVPTSEVDGDDSSFPSSEEAVTEQDFDLITADG
ncbi:hypothetical protein V5799_029814 [Amblyomma americanum]|uniref:Transmembrane protein n=1 Tax=Amblyomma americanum TaxID=6943 RepID=A0AAQ4EQ59_AMBAM